MASRKRNTPNSKQTTEEHQQAKFVAGCVIIFILDMLVYWGIWWIKRLF